MTLQWTAFGASSSTALYVFLYSVHYFVFKTRMNGFFQTAFYFGCVSSVGLRICCYLVVLAMAGLCMLCCTHAVLQDPELGL